MYNLSLAGFAYNAHIPHATAASTERRISEVACGKKKEALSKVLRRVLRGKNFTFALSAAANSNADCANHTARPRDQEPFRGLGPNSERTNCVLWVDEKYFAVEKFLSEGGTHIRDNCNSFFRKLSDAKPDMAQSFRWLRFIPLKSKHGTGLKTKFGNDT